MIEVKEVIIDRILDSYSKCKKYTLNEEVSEYMHYIEEEPFYIPPDFSDIKTDCRISSLNPKFVLFSAPGATGKSSLAKYIANKFDAIYWNLSKVKIGTNSFVGSILKAVNPYNYSEFIENLNNGKVLLVIDAFDEAEIISGRKMLSSFIADISSNLINNELPTVFLLSRTDTAQYISSFCAENSISLNHYEIGFFQETSAKTFITKSIVDKGKEPSEPDKTCVNTYYDVIKKNITSDERTSFLGYAPVLEAISKHIKTCSNRQKMISELSSQNDCVSIIMKIMDDLLNREQQEKVIPAFQKKCKELCPQFDNWNKIYTIEEQLVRIVHYILLNDTKYDNYELEFLPPQLVDEYQAMLDIFLPQHPFIRNNLEFKTNISKLDFTGPAFRDYTLAKIILNPKYEDLADMYFEESQSQSFFPSQIFFDCYMKISENNIYINHISYVYDSFKAKATALKTTYLQCEELPSSEANNNSYLAIFGAFDIRDKKNKEDKTYHIIDNNSTLQFDQLINVSINTPSLSVEIGKSGIDSRIYNSSIICKNIVWKSRNITVESYTPEESLLIAYNGFKGDGVSIDIAKSDNLKVNAPNINSYYKFIPYKYDFEDISDFDITKFIHALRCILVEFRTHKKDTLGKTADRIENVTVGNSEIKRNVLNYLKDLEIIYKSGHLYKINEEKMQAKGIHFTALSRMDTEQLNEAFLDFCKWSQNNL